METMYECPTCHATKTIKKPEHMTAERFRELNPESLPCGWMGCMDRARRLIYP